MRLDYFGIMELTIGQILQWLQSLECLVSVIDLNIRRYDGQTLNFVFSCPLNQAREIISFGCVFVPRGIIPLKTSHSSSFTDRLRDRK